MGDDGLGEGVAGVQFAAGAHAEDLVGGEVVAEGDDAGDQGPSEGEGAGLVEDDGSDPGPHPAPQTPGAEGEQ